jgi:hypothetical protein
MNTVAIICIALGAYLVTLPLVALLIASARIKSKKIRIGLLITGPVALVLLLIYGFFEDNRNCYNRRN